MSEFLCPRCFKKNDISKIKYICTNVSQSTRCSNSLSKKPITVSAGEKHPRCPECGQPLIIKVCPDCSFELPMGVGSTADYPIAIIGAKESGKSNYVAVLINQLKNAIGSSFNCALVAGGDKTINRYRESFYDPLYRNRTVAGATDSGDVEPLIYSLIFERKGGLFKKAKNDAVSLTFFDTAGENLNEEKTISTHNRYLSYSSGIILLLDPLQLTLVREKLSGKITLPQQNTDINDIVDRVANIIKRTNQIPDGTPIDIPIAVAFTKIDALSNLIGEESVMKSESSHINKGCFDLQNFNQSSEEMKGLIAKWMGDSDDSPNTELINKVSKLFKNYAFFGLSSLGSNPGEDKKIPKFRPFRTADPFLWILAQNGLIPMK